MKQAKGIKRTLTTIIAEKCVELLNPYMLHLQVVEHYIINYISLKKKREREKKAVAREVGGTQEEFRVIGAKKGKCFREGVANHVQYGEAKCNTEKRSLELTDDLAEAVWWIIWGSMPD